MKTILVFYVGLKDANHIFTNDYLDRIRKTLLDSDKGDSNIIKYIIPDYNEVGIKVECLNPITILCENDKTVVGELNKKVNKLSEYLSMMQKDRKIITEKIFV